MDIVRGSLFSLLQGLGGNKLLSNLADTETELMGVTEAFMKFCSQLEEELGPGSRALDSQIVRLLSDATADPWTRTVPSRHFHFHSDYISTRMNQAFGNNSSQFPLGVMRFELDTSTTETIATLSCLGLEPGGSLNGVTVPHCWPTPLRRI